MSALAPSLPQLLQGGASPAGPGAPPSDGDWEADLQKAIAALRELMGDAADNQEHAVVAQCYAQLQKLMAARQSGAESALGVTPAHRAMARAYGQ